MTAITFGSVEATELLHAKLPKRLRSEHYTMERLSNGLWRWQHRWPNGFEHVGTALDTPALAIENAARDYDWRVGMGQIEESN